MDTRELIHAEIDQLGQEQLNELYQLIKDLTRSDRSDERLSLMARLKRITIDAPPDFATNLDRYTSGERRAE
jgi:hypothetical protein